MDPIKEAKPAAVTPMPVPKTDSTGNVIPEPVIEPAKEPATEPVVEPVSEPIVEPDLSLEPATLEPTKVVAKETGNKNIDAVGQLLADKGVSNVDAILAEAIKGDLSISSQAEIVEALGESVAAMALSQLTNEVTSIKEKANAEKTRLMEYAANAFGDDPAQAAEVWVAIQEFAKSPESGLSAEDRAAMSKMLSAGGMQAELVIDKLNALYHQGENYTQEADLLHGEKTTVTSFEAISKTAYTEQMREISNKFGYDSPEADRLRAKRNESIRRGY